MKLRENPLTILAKSLGLAEGGNGDPVPGGQEPWEAKPDFRILPGPGQMEEVSGE